MGTSEQPFTRSSSPGPQHFGDVSDLLLKQGYGVRFRVPGRSMRPTILDGETIRVQPVSPPDIRQGDILLYRLRGGVVVHRVVGIGREQGDALLFNLRGDATGVSDKPVAAQQILGRVIYVERNGRCIDPCSRRAKIYRQARICASRLKRCVMGGVRLAMRRRFAPLFLVPVFLLFSLPLAGFGESLDAKIYKSSEDVLVKDNLLTVNVRRVPLKKLLAEIAIQAGIKVVIYGGAKELVFADFSGLSLEKGIRKLTRGVNCVLLYGPEKTETGEAKIREIIIYPKASDKAGIRRAPSIIDPNKRNQKNLKEASQESPLKTPEEEVPTKDGEEVPQAGKEDVGPPPEAKRAKRDRGSLAKALLQDEDKEIRANAARALGDLGDKNAIGPLITALQDTDSLVRENAVAALGRIGGKNVLPFLGKALQDKDAGVREAAANAIDGLGD